MNTLVFLITVVLGFALRSTCSAASILDPKSVSKSDLSGQKLVEMGTTFNISLLKLVGETIVKMEEDFNAKLCKISPCAEWSSWSKCSAVYRSVGFQARTRTCWYSSEDACAKTGATKTEKETRVCDGSCPDGYNITENSLCLKFESFGTTQSDAEAQCHTDGAHLMNVDTEARWIDLQTLARQLSLDNIWIDGKRTVAGGNWNYLSGIDPAANGVDHWKSGEPSDGRSELCKVSELSSGTRYWFDRDCHSKYAFVCEIRAA